MGTNEIQIPRRELCRFLISEHSRSGVAGPQPNQQILLPGSHEVGPAKPAAMGLRDRTSPARPTQQIWKIRMKQVGFLHSHESQ